MPTDWSIIILYSPGQYSGTVEIETWASAYTVADKSFITLMQPTTTKFDTPAEIADKKEEVKKE